MSVVLGTMTFGAEAQVPYSGVVEQLRAFTKAGHVLVDTARLYQCGTPDGDTETLLGRAFAEHPDIRAACSVATKVNPSMEPHKALTRVSVIEQCETSLKKLGMESVDILYLHWPDIKTPIEETLGAISDLHKAGKFKEFGLSNFPAWKVVDVHHRCRATGTVVPTVYQGMYNIITRDMERELLPVVRELGMRLYTYNPLAGGLLSGRYTKVEDMQNATNGRFSAEFDSAFGLVKKAGKGYQARYGKDEFFEALSVLADACNESGIPMSEAALRWLFHHSLLNGKRGDGVVLGASNISHLHSNLDAWHAGPLPLSVHEACNRAWALAAPACDSYFRGYGAEAGGIEGHLALYTDAVGGPDAWANQSIAKREF